MLELHLVGIETAAVLLQNHLDAISDLSRFCTGWRRQIVEGERTVVATGVVEHVDAIEVQNVEVHIQPQGRIHALHGANSTSQRVAHARQTQQFLR